MATQQQNINLLKIESNASPFQTSAFGILKKTSFICLFILLTVGIILGTLTVTLTMREEQGKAEQTALTKKIASAVVKEGMILDIRTRLTVINSILKKQKSPIPFIDSMTVVTEGIELSSLTIGENNTVTVGMKLEDISDAQIVVSRILKLVANRTINFPMLDSFVLDETGGIQMNVTYKVVI